MKRAFTNLMTLILLSFLLIGAIGIFQNIVTDLQKNFSSQNKPQGHILSYQRA